MHTRSLGKILYTTVALTTIGLSTFAQQKIKDGTVTGSATLPNSAAILELESNNKGLLLPRVNLTSTTTWGLVGSPVNGMIVYDTTVAITGSTAYPIIPGGKGFYYWDGNGWVTPSSSKGWLLNGNTGTTSPTVIGSSVGSANYWGTTDAQNLAIGTNSIARMIFDTMGNAYGGTNGSSVATSPNGGGNNRNFVWGRSNHVTDPSNLGNQNSNAVFGANNTVLGGGFLFGSTNIIAGSSNNVAASASAIFGNTNTDSALYSVVAGMNNILTPNGANSLLMGGGQTIAEGNYLSGGRSAVFGMSNKDSANFTFIAGQSNTIGAAGVNSVVLGNNNNVGSNNEVVAGYYNAFTTGSSTSAPTDGLLQVGNGSAATRSNAITVLKNGNVAIGTHTIKPNSTLQVNGSVSTAIRIITASDSLTGTDYTVIYTGGSTAPTLALPDPATCKGRMYRLVNAAGTGNYHDVTLSRPVFLYNGNSTTTLTLITFTTTSVNDPTVGNTAIIQSDGTKWWRVGF